jgi:acyl dehydratase
VIGEVAVGTELPASRVDDVKPDHIRLFALILRDPNPIHFDLDAVAEAGLGDREVNQGGATMAYVLNMLIGWAGSRAAVSRISCRFTANVFAGDDLLVGGRVTELSEVDGGRVAECDVWVDRIGGERALTGTASVRLH